MEPDAPRGAQAALLVICGGTAPGNELAAVVLPTKVEACVGVRLICLSVNMVLEAFARLLPVAPPVDEEDGIALCIDTGRRICCEPLLDG